MTLSTNVYVLGPVNVQELFRFGQSLLSEFDDQHRAPEQQVWSDSGSRIANQLGQGLPAILRISYSPDGPLRTAADAMVHDKWCDDDCTGEYHDRACWADLDLDTAYGYRNGAMGCGDLHAVLVARIGAWLDERGITWEWRNEFTGDVHGGVDRHERLADLTSGGAEAQAWFFGSVLPAIAKEIQR